MAGFGSATEFFAVYQPLIIAFALMAVLAFALLRLLLHARHVAEDELARLKEQNLPLYLERLENNRRLSLVFRRPVLLLYQLDGYLKTGDDGKIRQLIGELDHLRLEPRDRVEFLQKRMSFFVSVGEAEEARASFARLSAYLHAVKADEVDTYRSLLSEGEEVLRVYLDRDAGYLPELLEKAQREAHPVLRGVQYYRLAKLAYFGGEAEQARDYLKKAAETLAGTDYEELIRQALRTPAILEHK